MPLERIGHYTIVSELGRGGMGVVYLAHEESLNRYVAIKVLGEQLSDDPSFVTRFTREAQAVAALSHPNIIQIFFIGEDGGRHFFVMEYVKGKSLLALVKEQGRIANPRAAQYMLQAANGLAAAHDRGFLHRDIKPANMLVDERGLLKIADFGLALPQEAVTRLTATGMLVGTPGYLSPEQCMGEALDRRTDIYSLGVTFYEILTGVMPFKADSPLALLRKILQEEPPDVATLNAQVDEATRKIVNKMIAKDRTQRYQDCHALAADLGEYLGGTAKIAGAAGVAAVAGVVAPAAPPSDEMEGATARMPDSGAAAAPPGKTKPVSVSPEAPAAAPAPAQSAAAAGTTPPAAASAPPSSSAPAATATPPPAPGVEVIPPPSALVAAPQAMPVAAQAAAAPRKSHVGLVIGAVLVVFVAAIAAAGFFALRSPLVKRFLPWGSASKAAQPVEQAAQAPSEPAGTSAGSETIAAGAVAPPESAGAKGAGASAAAAAGNTGGSASAPTGSFSQAQPPPTTRRQAAVSSGTGSGEIAAPAAASAARSAAQAPALSGVAVGAEGERPIAGIVSGVLQSELQSAGLQPVDAATLPGTEDLFGGEAAAGVGEMLRRLRGEGVAKLVLARVEPAGSRELRYMGRSDTAYTSRVTVTCYDVATGRPRGRSLSATFESTSLNQEQAAEKALGPLIADIVQQLR